MERVEGGQRAQGEDLLEDVAITRLEAEDLAGEIELDLDPLPVVADMLEARKPGAPLARSSCSARLRWVMSVCMPMKCEIVPSGVLTGETVTVAQ